MACSMRYLVITCFLTFSIKSFAIDATLAEQYIQEYQQACASPQWQIWSESLCGPILLADPVSRQAVASHQGEDQVFKKKGSVFLGSLPEEVTIANTAKEWQGIRWTMLQWPVPKIKNRRLALMAHEATHRIQPKLGLKVQEGDNTHLNELMPRYWLIMELKALSAAISVPEAQVDEHIRNALLFREKRYQIKPEAFETERLLELNEGLAEYTGFKAVKKDALLPALKYRISDYENPGSLERSFAYYTGPLYGLLMDRKHPSWRKAVKSDFSFYKSLSQLIDRTKQGLQENLKQAITAYDGETVQLVLESNQKRLVIKLQAFNHFFTERPVLELPLQAMQMRFDPNAVYSLRDLGTVYVPLTVVDSWGKIQVNNFGGLIDQNFQMMRVRGLKSININQEGSLITSDDWVLELAEGWRFEEIKEAGVVKYKVLVE